MVGVPGANKAVVGCALRPNPSLEATSIGGALGPRIAASYHALRGPSAPPLAAPQLKR